MVLNYMRQTWNDLSTSPFSLQDIEGFPYTVYEDQITRYEEAESWYKGIALSNQPEFSGSQVDLYPLRLNPLLGTVMKHAYMLFGEVQDDGRPLVYPRMVLEDKGTKDTAAKAESTLNHVWWENSGRSIMMENGILSQIYGGCVFKATYVPWESKEYGGWRDIPIRIERINPKDFIGFPDAGDMNRLSEAWIIRQVPYQEAIKWGYTGDDSLIWMVEHWLPKTIRVWMNGKPVIKRFTDIDYVYGGENPFGFIPIQYIPHVRSGDFLGVNAIDHLKGLVKELNLRFADYGDAVNDDAHSYVAMRNVQGSPQMKTIAEGLKVVDLGSASNITSNEPEPDLFAVGKQRAGTAMRDLVDELTNEYRRESFVPAVAEGEDEGSQRSALTLATRFWPLTSHVGIERIFWSAGMDVFQTNLLKMMSIQNISGITESHTSMRMKQKWAPMLPRDREADVQEWVQRVSANLGSIKHLLELTGDVEDVDAEEEEILDWLEKLAKIQAMAQPVFGQPGAGGSPQSGEQPKKKMQTVAEKKGGGGGKE